MRHLTKSVVTEQSDVPHLDDAAIVIALLDGSQVDDGTAGEIDRPLIGLPLSLARIHQVDRDWGKARFPNQGVASFRQARMSFYYNLCIEQFLTLCHQSRPWLDSVSAY